MRSVDELKRGDREQCEEKGRQVASTAKHPRSSQIPSARRWSSARWAPGDGRIESRGAGPKQGERKQRRQARNARFGQSQGRRERGRRSRGSSAAARRDAWFGLPESVATTGRILETRVEGERWDKPISRPIKPAQTAQHAEHYWIVLAQLLN